MGENGDGKETKKVGFWAFALMLVKHPISLLIIAVLVALGAGWVSWEGISGILEIIANKIG
jgi:hypothetical protein